jgi:hypothetical protein
MSVSQQAQGHGKRMVPWSTGCTGDDLEIQDIGWFRRAVKAES